MTSSVTVTYLENRSGTFKVPVNELRHRVIQQHNEVYTQGEWNPDVTYRWAPGSYVDFTPLKADSRIRYIWRIPQRWITQGHSISHWKFYVANTIYYYHSQSATYLEDGNAIIWEVPSWGTFQERIGYQIRAYQNDNHELRLYSTTYWDGSGSQQVCHGQLIVEEIVNVSVPEAAGEKTYTAK